MATDRWLPMQPEEILTEVADMVRRREAGVLATVIGAQRSTPRDTGAKMIIRADGRTLGTVGGGAAEARVIAEAATVLADGRYRRLDLDLDGATGVCGGGMEVFLEPILSAWPLIVVGAGHVGRALAIAGRDLPLRVTLVDDRPGALTDLEAAPGMTAVRAGPEEMAALVSFGPRSAVVIASREHGLDTAYADAVLGAETAAEMECPFLGLLGSRAKITRIRADLRARGHAEDRLERMQAPIGLDIGAEGPAEVAVSVLAEVLAVLKGVDPLRDESGRPLGLRLHRRRP